MSVTWLWTGRVTPTSFRVRGEVAGASVRLLVSTDDALTDPLIFGPVTPVAHGAHDIATIDATDLQQQTAYHFAFEVDDVTDAAWQGKAKTAAQVGSAQTYKFWAFSCAGQDNSEASTTDNVSNRPSFQHIIDRDCDFGIHLGDLHYRDIEATTLAPHREVYGDVLTFNGTQGADALQGKLYRSAPVALTTDDHEFGPNDSDTTSDGREQFQVAYREMVPSYDLPAVEPSATEYQGGIWHSFVRGRVRFIISDLRTERSPKAATDNADKVAMGEQQEAWFFDELLAAKEAGQAICWANSKPWISDVESGSDRWGGYGTYRDKLVDFFTEHDLTGRMFIVAGDMHGLAIDDGRNNAWGGFPVFQFASMDANPSVKGGPYWKGPTEGRDRYGVVEVEDTGGDKITVTGTGWISNTPWDSHTFDIALPKPALPWGVRGKTVSRVTVNGDLYEVARTYIKA